MKDSFEALRFRMMQDIRNSRGPNECISGGNSGISDGRIGGQWRDVVDVRLPNGMGARFAPDGSFSGFLD